MYQRNNNFIMDVQQLFKSIKKEAECPLCLDTVKNPKTLPCLHSFCQECLEEMANFARGQQQETINCPVCQTSFPIPETDTFANLPSSFYLNRLVDVLALEDDSIQAQKCDSWRREQPGNKLLLCLPELSVRNVLSMSPTLKGHKGSSQCFDQGTTSSRCARVDPQTHHVFTAKSRRPSTGILL